MMTKAIRTLELDKILERLAGYSSFSAAGDLARALRPTGDLKVAQRWVAETTEARWLLDIKPDASVGGSRDVRSVAARAFRGVVLLPQDLLDVRHTLAAAARLKRTILRGDYEYPLLAEMARGIVECPDLIAAIDQALDDQGQVLDSASPKLGRLRRELRIVRERVQEKLQRLLGSQASKYLQEPIISQRGGRWVVPVQANFKGRIRELYTTNRPAARLCGSSRLTQWIIITNFERPSYASRKRSSAFWPNSRTRWRTRPIRSSGL